MSIALAEQLKQKLTDKFVVVRDGVAELRRFQGLTGTVKTVNMNCRALVQFDGSADIAWYDIDPGYLEVVEAPLPKKASAAHTTPAPTAAQPSVKPASSGKSPLELAREQAAAKSAGGSGEKKLSPLELARQQGAAKATGASPAASAPGEKKLSPLELARMQGAAKPKTALVAPAEPPATQTAQDVAAPIEAVPPAPPELDSPSSPSPDSKTGAALTKPGSTAEILALIRQQGAIKR